MCLLTEANCMRDEAMFVADSSQSAFIHVASFRILGAIAHLLEVLVCIEIVFFFVVVV